MSRPHRPAMQDLGWSLWTELGVPGVVREHRHVVVDLEVLVLLTPLLAKGDSRLELEALRWCRHHGQWLSTSRLKGLMRGLSSGMRSEVQGFLDACRAPASSAPPCLRLERPSLLQLRLRTLCGVGARADTLGFLLGRQGRPASAGEIAWLGYSKRTVSGILTELTAGGLVNRFKQGNRQLFDLARPAELEVLLQAEGLRWVDWRAALGLLGGIEDLACLEEKTSAVRRVRAVELREVLVPFADRLHQARPPRVAGEPHSYEQMLDWANATLEGRLAGDIL